MFRGFLRKSSNKQKSKRKNAENRKMNQCIGNKRLSAAAVAMVMMFASFSCQSAKAEDDEENSESDEEFVYESPYIVPDPLSDALSYKEIWGYVMEGREKEFNRDVPITDVGYFVSSMNVYSEMPKVPARSKFFKNYKGRVHLVTSVDSQTQAHLLLDPTLPLRERIIAQMIEAAESYEGLQIDWENIPKSDTERFFDFLKIVREKLPKEKILSIATKARLKTLKDDPFAYAPLAKVADKILIMAYDEHWSTSAPGAIASTNWCKRIAEYAQTQISEEKLIMGVSLYGRTWLSAPVRGQAWYSSGIERIKRENGISEVKRDEYGIPHFSFTETATITGWYDDAYSLRIRCQMYSDLGIKNIGFWRLGFEVPEFWQHIKLDE